MTTCTKLLRCECHGTQVMCAREGDRIVIERTVGHITHRFTIVVGPEQMVPLDNTHLSVVHRRE